MLALVITNQLLCINILTFYMCRFQARAHSAVCSARLFSACCNYQWTDGTRGLPDVMDVCTGPTLTSLTLLIISSHMCPMLLDSSGSREGEVRRLKFYLLVVSYQINIYMIFFAS